MAKILLLGGTGAMGVYLQEILAKTEHVVYVTTRSVRSGNGRIRFCIGNAHNFDFVSKLLRSIKPDVIVDFMVYGTNEFAERKDTLLQSCYQYIFLSSYRVFAEQTPLTERSPRLLDVCADKTYLKTDEYGIAKARQEDLLLSGKCRNWTIVRPGITYSKTRFQFGCLEANVVCFRAFHSLPVVMPSQMFKKKTVMTWGGDVARMIAGLLLCRDALGEDFNVATSESINWEGVAEIYKREIGLKVRPCSYDDYVSVVGNQYQIKYDRMFNRVIDNSKIIEITGIDRKSLCPIHIGLAKELSGFKISPSYESFDVRRNALIDNILGTDLKYSLIPGLENKFQYYLFRHPRVRYSWLFQKANAMRKRLIQ